MSRAAAEASTARQPAGLPDRFQYQRQHLCLRLAQRPFRVLGRAGDEFLPGGDGHRVAEPAPGAQQRGEHRAGVGDQRDRPAGQRVRFHVADRAQPAGHVDEAHAARPAHRHARGPGRGGQPVAQAGLASRARAGRLVRAAEDDRGPVTALRGQRDLFFEGRVRHGQQHQVHGFGQVGQGCVAPCPGDLGVPRVDQVGPWRGRAPGHLGDHPLAQAALPRAGPDQRHPPRLQHRAECRAVVRRRRGGRGRRWPRAGFG